MHCVGGKHDELEVVVKAVLEDVGLLVPCSQVQDAVLLKIAQEEDLLLVLVLQRAEQHLNQLEVAEQENHVRIAELLPLRNHLVELKLVEVGANEGEQELRVFDAHWVAVLENNGAVDDFSEFGFGLDELGLVGGPALLVEQRFEVGVVTILDVVEHRLALGVLQFRKVEFLLDVLVDGLEDLEVVEEAE